MPVAAPSPARTKLLIAALTVLVAGVALCVDRNAKRRPLPPALHGRFISAHGFVTHDPFPTISQGRPWLNQQWLSELGFYTAARSIGITGLTSSIRPCSPRRSPSSCSASAARARSLLIATAALYIPGILAIVHPQAAGFTLLAFCVLVARRCSPRGFPARSGLAGAGSTGP